jgi:archaeal flagellar protein FlaJ
MLDSIALKLFGKFVTPYIDYFEGLRYNIKRARMSTSVQQYLSNLLLYCLIAFMVAVISGSFIFAMIIKELQKQKAEQGSTMLIEPYSYTLSIIVGLMVTLFTFYIGYYYPSMIAKSRGSKIDRSLPFAVSYMATTASSGVNAISLFKMLAFRGGEVGKEANRIYNNVTSLGMSLNSALQHAAMRSPSPTFADLLWGMISILTTGGDMESYLRNKSRTYMSQYRRMLNDYAKSITLYTEVYITLVIVGSLFFIVLISIMSPMTGMNTLFMQTLIVFFVIPIVSMAFMVLLKTVSPIE